MKHGINPRALLLPICWAKGHRIEGESIIKARIPAMTYIKRCDRCDRYILHTHIGEMTLAKKAALDLKSRHDRAIAFQAEETEESSV